MRDYLAECRSYCDSVLNGSIVAGRLLRKAVQRHLDDLQRADSDPDWPFYFDPWHAADVCDFLEKLPHVEGRWHCPTVRLQPWQTFILASVFGWRRRSDGTRRFRYAYVEVARKNGKSLLTSGIALYCLCCEGEIGPQIKCAATTANQARIVFDVAAKMVRATPDLAAHFGLQLFANSIRCERNNGSIQPINSKSSTQDGLNPHLVIIDELHAHKDRSLFDVLRSSFGARANPLSWYITTAGYNTQGICIEQRDLVAKILEGVLSVDDYFGVVFTIDEGDDPFDETVWSKANPNLGVSVSLDAMRSYAEQAKASPGAAGEFKTKRLNVWMSTASAWLDMDAWHRCADPEATLAEFAGCRAAIGADLADTNDTAAVVMLLERDGKFHAFSWFFLPEELVDRAAHRTTTHYRTWADAGHITTTPGDFIDHNAIEAKIRELVAGHDVVAINLEHHGAQQMAASLLADNLPVALVQKSAGSYSEPAKLIEAYVEIGRLRHDGNPVLTWTASNCVVQRRVDGTILPKKEHKDSPKKVDGIDALILALKGMGAERPGSIFDGVDLSDPKALEAFIL